MYSEREKIVSYIGLGSNLYDRKNNILVATNKIKKIKDTFVNKSSSIYENDPVGYENQGKFLNSVVEIFTLLSPKELLVELQNIEFFLKRERTIHWGPRTMDLDILFYGNSIIKEKDLMIPHEHLTERAFVLVPLAEIAPEYVNPATNKNISTHLIELGEIKGIYKI